jgi:protein tyrosine phosphatase (PTP) superfamily phosphohydrolase (DUF442 family)
VTPEQIHRTHSGVPAPAAERNGAGGLSAIPNFAWVDEGRLARGRQPEMTPAMYRELRGRGFSAVLSLRAEQEYLEDPRRSYNASHERELCDALGLTFHHVACTDFQAPQPAEVVRALSIIHDEAEQGRAVYVHCFAGIGRTGVISGAWQMLHGASGTEALRDYAYFCEEGWRRRVIDRTLPDYLHTIRAHHQAWVLVRIARELGLPAALPQNFIRPQRPDNGRLWRRRFREELQRRLPHVSGTRSA